MRSLRLLVPVVLLASVTPAHAGQGIVLEAYTGDRPDAAARAVEPVLDELAARGYVAGSEAVGRLFEARVSRSAGELADLPVGFADQIERGQRAWVAGKFDDAVGLLSPLVTAAHTNTGAFVGNPELHAQLVKALIVLGLSQHRLGDPAAARQTFAELIRSVPDAAVPRGTYGPEAATLFEQIRKEVTAGAKGHLLVKLANEDGEVYVNERLERRGTTARDVLPGEYRVVVQLGNLRSRNHRVIVKAGEDTTITIDHGFDAVVHSSPGWAGLAFKTAAEREKTESSYAATFANAIDGKAVVVVSVDTVQDHLALIGSVVSLINGHEVRRASLALEPAPTSDRVEALAKFLAGEKISGGGIDIQLDGAMPLDPTPGTRPPSRDDDRRWGGWTWIAGGAAVVALGAGGALLALDGDCRSGGSGPNCPDLYSTATPGWIAIGGGAVLTGLTIYLIATRPARPARQAFVAPTRGGAIAGVTSTF
jgi:hypothetical protein